MLPVSACIIARNEEKYIETCLQKLKKSGFEIIVTDTGSTDRTVSIARNYTEHIYHFPWINDFSAARNFCISKASNNWILNVDSDEYLENGREPHTLHQILLPFFSHPESVGLVDIINPHAASINDSVSIEPVARFFHKEYYHYEGMIHEQPVSSKKLPPAYMKIPLSFYHIGYSNEAVLAEKASRNIRLLKEALTTSPDDPYLFFQLGQSYFVTGDMEHAYEAFEQGLSFDVDPRLQYVQTMVESYGYCLLHLKQYEKALQLNGVYDAFCSHADFVFLMGLIYMNNALFDDAIAQFLHAATLSSFSVKGVNSYLAYYNVGVIYECTGHKNEAKAYYQKCGKYAPAIAALKRL